MDSLIAASARALAAGDALGALRHVALRDDPPALALRGIAMAQLGEYPRARQLLRRAARAFGPREVLARARCVVADAEVALALRELGGPPRALADAIAVLEALGDTLNARHARAIAARRSLLLGRRDAAADALAGLDADRLPPPLSAVAWLTAAEIDLRGLRTQAAAQALARAQVAATQSRIPSLMAEVAEAQAALERPAARCIDAAGQARPLRLAEIESLFASGALVLDACRRGMAMGGAWLPLARRRRSRSPHMSQATAAPRPTAMPAAQPAEIVREYGPLGDPQGDCRVHGVSWDGRHVLAATGEHILVIDPASGQTVRRIAATSDAGTAFDGTHVYQVAEARIDKIDPATGRVVKSIPAPGHGNDSGLTWAEGSLWVGQYQDRRIHQIDPDTGAIRRTIESNRFVTGVTFVQGDLWHGTWEENESELRRVDTTTGEVLERLAMPAGAFVSGLESDGAGLFYAGGGSSGMVRAVRRPGAKRG